MWNLVKRYNMHVIRDPEGEEEEWNRSMVWKKLIKQRSQVSLWTPRMITTKKRKNAENKNQEKNLKNFHVKRHITFKGVNMEINLNES